MKTKSLVLLLILLGFAAALAPRQVMAEEEASFQFFYDSLQPYGQWLQVGDYGLCWHPSGVDSDWAPYTDGYWTYTDGGWTWVSYEDYGGVVYHYGRWINTEEEGWCWVPDYEWAPAWVSWRSSDDYVGWAPLPPECHWQPEVGVSIWADTSYDIGPECYHFCRFHDFGAPVISAVLLPRRENFTIIASTVNITNISYNRGAGVIFVGGPRFDVISRRVGRPIPTLKLVQQTNVTNFFVNGQRPVVQAVQRGNALFVPAPKLKPTTNPQAMIPNFKPSKVVATAHVNRGWNLVKNPQERDQLRQTLQAQTQGQTPQSAPARAVQPSELKVVPQKLNPAAVVAGSNNRASNGKGGASGEPIPGLVSDGTGKPGKEKPGKIGGTNPPVGPAPITAGGNGRPKKGRGAGAEAIPQTPTAPVTANPGPTEENVPIPPKAHRGGGPTGVQPPVEVQPPSKGVHPDNVAAEQAAQEQRNQAEARQLQQERQQQLEAQKRQQAQAGEEKRNQAEARQSQIQKQQQMEAQRNQAQAAEERRNQAEARQNEVQKQQQIEAQRNQAQALEERRNQAEARQALNQRQQQMEAQRARQPQPQAQQQPAQRSPAPAQNQQNSGDGKKKLTPEEAAALRNRQ